MYAYNQTFEILRVTILSPKTSVYKNSSRKEYDITDAKRAEYRRISRESRLAKLAAEQGLLQKLHDVNTPCLEPNDLMPLCEKNGLRTLSLFSGGGGLDLGFDRAGFEHVASYELIPVCKETFALNRPLWQIYAGPEEGDVTKVDWHQYVGAIDIIHGGPPCQPFSIAGEQKGLEDERNMWGEFNRAVNTIKPKAFVAENVMGLLNPKFSGFVKKYILEQLQDYSIIKFEMHTADYGVPQIRRRVFFVGFRDNEHLVSFQNPEPTYCKKHLVDQAGHFTPSFFDKVLPDTLGVRHALGLPKIGYDNLAPTIRSAFTGKRNTTSVLNSSAGQKSWRDLGIWPNGVQIDREKASAFPSKNGDFRLSVQDVALLQGFPEDWRFAGAVYQVLGQIGNSVSPPVAYNVAIQVSDVLNR